MRDVHIVLREKETEIERIRREVDALRWVTPLLADVRSNALQIAVLRDGSAETTNRLSEALRTVAPLLVDASEDFDPAVRARLVEATENDARIRAAKKISHQLRHLAMPLLGAHRR